MATMRDGTGSGNRSIYYAQSESPGGAESMPDEETPDKSDKVVDLLLREHQEAYTMYRHSEDLGERRVRFFVTLTTAVVAALTIRTEGVTTGNEVDPLFYYFLAALLLFGIVTLRRMMVRNVTSYRQLRAIARINAYFSQLDQEAIGSHLEFFSPDWGALQRESKWSTAFTLGRGGLVETVALINSVLVAFLVGLITFDLTQPESESEALVAGGCAFVIAWAGQCAWTKLYYDAQKRKPKQPEG